MNTNISTTGDWAEWTLLTEPGHPLTACGAVCVDLIACTAPIAEVAWIGILCLPVLLASQQLSGETRHSTSSPGDKYKYPISNEYPSERSCTWKIFLLQQNCSSCHPCCMGFYKSEVSDGLFLAFLITWPVGKRLVFMQRHFMEIVFKELVWGNGLDSWQLTLKYSS